MLLILILHWRVSFGFCLPEWKDCLPCDAMCSVQLGLSLEPLVAGSERNFGLELQTAVLLHLPAIF
jgi:hypothetical protein